MKRFIDLIFSYKFTLFTILLYELFYILIGYKGNGFSTRNDNKFTDNIPCPYYFLSMIYNKIKDENISSFIDLGCGNGRVLHFFSRKLNIEFLGVEMFANSYNKSLKIFKNIKNVKIINKNFFDINFNDLIFDCYFLNEPLKQLEDHNKLISSILSSHRAIGSNAMFILVNLGQQKYEVFNNLELLFKYELNSKNIRIYKTKNIQ